MQSKFSTLAYAEEIRALHSGQAAEAGGEEWFFQLVEDVRGELAASRGKTEEERMEFTDTLNRAVLGYEEERRKMLAVVQDLLAAKRISAPPPAIKGNMTLAEAVFAEITGWNVLESVLQGRVGLEEIQVVGQDVFEVRGGIPTLSPVRFRDVKEVERLQQNLVLFNSDTLNMRKKWAEVMLRDGSRVTMTGLGFTSQPTLTIRYYARSVHDLDMLADERFGTAAPPIVALLRSLVRSCFNLVVTGPTNSGKTTLIKAMIKEMPDHERLVTIEGRYELMIKRDFPWKNVVEYEVDEEDGMHNGNRAFKLALRQSPKRICHAEIRDDDANLYVRACTRGHQGSVTTVHVNVLEDVPDAIADMCLMDGRSMNADRLVRRIAEYVTQVGIEMSLFDGKRRVARVGEYVYEQGMVRIQDWVRYDDTTEQWRYPMALSSKSKERLMRFDPDGWAYLEQLMEGAASC